MKILMLVAHGSRNHAANDEIGRLARHIQKQSGQEYDAVVAAFLEIADPDIVQGIGRCIELGADSIVAVPYFLAAGNHVTVDIPAEIARARIQHPDISIEISQYLGDNEAMAELVLQCSRQLASCV